MAHRRRGGICGFMLKEEGMHNDPTLRDVTQAFAAWLMAESQGIKDWIHGLGDIHVSTMMSILLLGCTSLFGWILRNWLVQLMALAQQYHARGDPWRRGLRLAPGQY